MSSIGYSLYQANAAGEKKAAADGTMSAYLPSSIGPELAKLHIQKLTVTRKGDGGYGLHGDNPDDLLVDITYGGAGKRVLRTRFT